MQVRPASASKVIRPVDINAEVIGSMKKLAIDEMTPKATIATFAALLIQGVLPLSSCE